MSHLALPGGYSPPERARMCAPVQTSTENEMAEVSYPSTSTCVGSAVKP